MHKDLIASPLILYYDQKHFVREDKKRSTADWPLAAAKYHHASVIWQPLWETAVFCRPQAAKGSFQDELLLASFLPVTPLVFACMPSLTVGAFPFCGRGKSWPILPINFKSNKEHINIWQLWINNQLYSSWCEYTLEENSDGPTKKITAKLNYLKFESHCSIITFGCIWSVLRKW